jgi:hypothetical protein
MTHSDPDGLRIRELFRERKALEPTAHQRAEAGDATAVERIASIDTELETLGVRRVPPAHEIAPTLGPGVA